MPRFLVFGLVGWCIEIVFTSVTGALGGDRSLTGTTYLWMLPIYGAGGLALDWLRRRLVVASAPRLLRAAAYVLIIFAVEYSSGFVLRHLLGRCPWDYGCSGLSVHGLIRLDYAPAWFLCGVLFEMLASVLDRVDGALARQQRAERISGLRLARERRSSPAERGAPEPLAQLARGA